MMNRSLVVLLLAAAPAAAMPKRAANPSPDMKGGIVRPDPAAIYSIGAKLDLRMVRASMPGLLHPAIQQPVQGDAVRAQFERMVEATRTEADQELIAVRRRDQVALVPARWRGAEENRETARLSLASIHSLASPAFASVNAGVMRMIHEELRMGNVGLAFRLISGSFDGAARR